MASMVLRITGTRPAGSYPISGKCFWLTGAITANPRTIRCILTRPCATTFMNSWYSIHFLNPTCWAIPWEAGRLCSLPPCIRGWLRNSSWSTYLRVPTRLKIIPMKPCSMQTYFRQCNPLTLHTFLHGKRRMISLRRQFNHL